MCAAVYAEGTPTDADEMAARLMPQIQARWGGAEVYIPALDARAGRDAAIRELFNGRNLLQVCKQFGVSSTTVYRVVAVKRTVAESDTR